MKRHTFILSLCVFLLLLSTPISKLHTAQAAGTTDWAALTQQGHFSLNGVYYISSAEELLLFRDMINAHPNDSTVYSCTFYLTADIAVNEPESFLYSNKGHIRGTKTDIVKWTPIGCDYASPFKATFDGQGHTISGLYCNPETGYAGLFGYLSGGSAVRNVHVANSYFYARDGHAGGITAAAGSTTISNCSFEGFLYARGTGGSAYSAGGIAGYLEYGKVDGCTVNASIVSYSAGGIAGTLKNYGAQVTNCLTAGEVTALNDNHAVGGIVGRLLPPASVRNCGSSMDICSTFGAGICGQTGDSGGTCTVENCWFSGDFTGDFTGDVIANPILAGITVVTEGYEAYVSVLNCYASSRSNSYLFRSTSYKQYPDNGENGGGFFDPDSTVVRTTTSNGFTGYWFDDGAGSTEFRAVADSPYALSGRTDLVTALNGWAAAHSSGSYRLWSYSEDGLPHFVTDIWSEAADSSVDLTGETVHIFSAEQLAYLAAMVNSGNSFEGKTVILQAPIDLRGRFWTPIGSQTSPFAGTFDGSGHTISNLLVSSTQPYQGLFGSTAGTLRNIHVANATVIGGSNSGGIVGSTSAPIDSCSFSGAVYGTSAVGGIAGSGASTVYNSRNAGIITGSSLKGAVVGSNSGTVGNCFTTGAVHDSSAVLMMSACFYTSGVDTAFDISTCYGQIAGSGTVHSCYDAASVSVDSEALLTALSEAAAGNAAYTPWTFSHAANDGLPYYAAFSGGSGTALEPWRITSVEQLAYLATLVNSNPAAADDFYRLEADLTLNDGYFDAAGQWYTAAGAVRKDEQLLVWTPIGTEEIPFTGSFDGAGHTISGLYCTGEMSGLFGTLSGSVSNLLLTNGYFSGSGTAVAGQGSGAVANCASTCVGSGGGLSGTNCWDSCNVPSLTALNSWVAAQGGSYCRWYAVPGSTYLSFQPTLIPIVFTMNGGTLADGSACFPFGEVLTLPSAPSRPGYTFAGWSVYPNESGNESQPTAMFATGTVNLSNVSTLRLEALWAENGTSLTDHCTANDGAYVLNSDVILADSAVFTEDTVLDLNGHFIGGISETALLWTVGCRLELRNSGADVTLRTNTALGGGIGGEIAAAGSGIDLNSTAATVSSGDSTVCLTVFSPLAGGSGNAYRAVYSDTGKMLSITAHPGAADDSAVFVLPAGDLSATRVFILPGSWLAP